VDRNGLIGIGGFSLLTGISVSALRHYDEVGVLVPAFVDPDSSYRYYAPSQVGAGRLVRELRAVDLPIEQIREMLASADPAILVAHRDALVARGDALAQMLDRVDQLIERGVTMPVATASKIVQVKVHVEDLPQLVSFYEAAFGASYDESISSFTFGTYPDAAFFLLTTDEPEVAPARFGLLVDDVDEAHAAALSGGADEVFAPVEASWKPRCSRIADPSGNVVDLYQR
jgi:DNA-binding transcriptional MerR regulator